MKRIGVILILLACVSCYADYSAIPTPTLPMTAGWQNIFSLSVAPYNVQAYGATTGDDTDDSTAFAAAIAAAGNGGAIEIPPGIYDIDVAIDMSTTIVSWYGAGSNRTVIQFGDLSGADAITLGTTDYTRNCWIMQGVSLVTEGGEGEGWIEDVIQANRLMHGIIRDVQIACNTDRAGIHLNGCIYWGIYDYCAQIGGANGWAAEGGGVLVYENRPYIGLHIDDIDNVMASNAISIYNMRAGFSEHVILCDPNHTGTPSSNINIYGGAWEAAQTNVVWFENTQGVSFNGLYGTDFNQDNPFYFSKCKNIALRSVRTYCAEFEDCNGVSFTDCMIYDTDAGTLSFDDECMNITFNNCGFQNPFTMDEIWDTVNFAINDSFYLGASAGAGAGDEAKMVPIEVRQQSKRNLMYNSEMLITGGGTAPTGWTKPAAITWSQITGRRAGGWAAQAVATGSTASSFTHPHINDIIEELEDGYGCFVAWVNNTNCDNGATYPFFRVRVVSTAEGNMDWYSHEYSRRPRNNTGTWEPVFCPFWVYDAGDVTDIQIVYYVDEACTTAIADPMIVAGPGMPRFWEPSVYGVTYKFAVDDATPSVAGVPSNVFLTGDDNALNVTDFDDGRLGQIITIIGGDTANTTVKHDNTKVNMAGGADWNGADGDVLVLVYDGTDWNEISRSDNTP